MASNQIDQITFDGASDASFESASIVLSEEEGYLWTIELVSPITWPRQQFLIVERALRRGGQQYRLNPVFKLYLGNHRDAFAFPVPKDLFNNDPRCSVILSPRYYGPAGLRVGTTTIRVAYEDRQEYDISMPL